MRTTRQQPHGLWSMDSIDLEWAVGRTTKTAAREEDKKEEEARRSALETTKSHNSAVVNT